MSESSSTKTPQSLHQEVQEIWDGNAAWWDEYIGPEGNDFHRLLVAPATERLLNLRPNELVLDVACGNGQFSRRMAQLGAQVVAFDFSRNFIERAKGHTTEHVDRIEYRVIDATDTDQLMTLGTGRFDAAVCNNALMDMTTIEPLASALGQLLKPGGRFVFCVSHPCFNSTGCRKIVEEEDREGELITTYAIKVSAYIEPVASKGVGIIGQPAPHYYFDRPISLLFNTFFRAGFALDGIEEPAFDRLADGRRTFSWSNYPEIPPALIARMRLI
ncbi:MAG: class I SAM-dependent methyltransferase [Candidatus Poribacteria bacterium]|nr:class I SAM-dependent methyltransferase [Candidatus Poribacteria bacterium]